MASPYNQMNIPKKRHAASLGDSQKDLVCYLGNNFAAGDSLPPTEVSDPSEVPQFVKKLIEMCYAQHIICLTCIEHRSPRTWGAVRVE